MTRLWRIFKLLWQAHPWAMWRGALAALAVLVMGAGLLGLSGWFITATGAAGLAGIGIAFDVFRPSAGIRFLALGRAGSRYAERLLTHDATLRALARLRLALLRALEELPINDLRRMRSAQALTRVTADVDALDGLVLRLGLPILAGLVTHALVFALLWHLTTPAVALSVLLGFVLAGGLILLRLGRQSLQPSAEAERRRQSLRRRGIGLFRGQRDVIQQGLLPRRRAELAEIESGLLASEDALDRAASRAGLTLGLCVTAAAALALWAGGAAVMAGHLTPAAGAIGIFVALALGETLLPLARGVADLGRMYDAAGRVETKLPEGENAPATGPDPDAGLVLQASAVQVSAPGRAVALFAPVDLTLRAGETLALTGPSGGGKSSLLDVLAGLRAPSSGRVALGDRPIADWPEPALRAVLTLLPQRSLLIGGTVRDNLALAVDGLTDEDAWAALCATRLDGVIEARGGLGSTLSEAGGGLSGGEARRLCLARALLRRPQILLLDEPTEGLDDALARDVLQGIRAFLPDAAILMASHRAAERQFATREINIGNIS